LLDPEQMLKRYHKMIYKVAWITAKRWGMDFDDVQAQGHLVFMDAIGRFENGKGAKFGTYLFNRLKTLDDYCERERKYHGRAVKMLIEDLKNNPQRFYKPMDVMEHSQTLSPDAQEVLRYILGATWEKPGSNKIPSQYSILKEFRERDWAYQRIKDAWEELRLWYQKIFGGQKLAEKKQTTTYENLVAELFSTLKTTSERLMIS
jgi:hypothetical protein